MEKYSRLSFTKQKALLEEFCRVLLTLKTEDEAVKFLIDLLTKEEVIKLAKRIKIAQLLLEGKEYRKIQELLNVSHATIAKVSEWLRESGEGFRLVFKRIRKRKAGLKPETIFSEALREWKNFKRRYPGMFWPSLFIEGIMESANKKQREKITEALSKLDHKSKIYKEISKLLKKD
jgi:TrpR-related protein YerC/YecD